MTHRQVRVSPTVTIRRQIARALAVLGLIGVVLGGVASILPVGTATAATGIYHAINFQGKVVNSNGTNVSNGNYTFVFKLYSVSSAGSAIWTESKTLTVTDGVFQTALGDTTSLPGSVDFNTDNIFLGINFNSDGEMSPRIQFTSAAYAFNSEKLGGLTSAQFAQLSPGSAQSGFLNVTGNVSSGATIAAATSLQAPLVDTASAVALNIGTGTASSVTIGRTTTPFIVQGNSSSTFTATNSTFTTTVGFTTPTANNSINFPNAGGTVCTTVATTCSATYGTTGSYIAKNASDTSSFAVTATNYLYGFTNSSSAVASGVLKLDNGNNTGSGLTVVGSGNPAAGQALIVANAATGVTGNLIDLQLNAVSKFSVTQGGAVTTASTINAQTISAAASFTGTVTAATSLLAPLIDTAAAGTLSVGTGTATTVNIGRSAAALSITGNGATAGTNIVDLRVTGDANPRFTIGADGKLSFGPGSAATDASISRTGAKTLTVVANLVVSGGSPSTTLLKAVNQNASQIAFVAQGTASPSANLIELQDNNSLVNASFSGLGNQLTLGRIAASGVVTQGKLLLSDGTTDNFSTTLQSTTLTTGNQTITIPDTAGAGGTICLQSSASCNFAPGTAASYIQNQNAGAQASANFNISGTGTAATALIAPFQGTADVAAGTSASVTFASGNGTAANANSGNVTVDTGSKNGSGTTGAVNIGTTNASSINLGRSGSTLTIQGNASTTLAATSGANTTTVGFTAPTAARAISFPDAGGTICTTVATTCNSVYTAAGSYLLQNPAANNASTSNFTGYQYSFTQSASTAAGNLQLSNAGTSSALSLTQSGNPSAGQAALLVNNSNGTPSGNLIDLQTGGTSQFKVSTAGAVTTTGNINGQTISSAASFTGTVTAATGLTVSAGGITVSGNSTITGTLGGLTGLTVANGGETITAGGLTVTAGGINVNATGITNAGAISGATTIAASTSVSAPTLSSADTAVASTNSAVTTFRSGNASGATSNSGAVSVDSGTATGTAGTVAIGGTNSSGTTVGRSGALLTLQGNASTTFAATSGANTTTVGFTAPTAARAINFPDAGGTLCTTTASTCNATYQAAGSYLLQNPAANNASTSNFTGYQYSFTQSASTAAGNLQLTNAGTSSALSVSQSGNPSAGQALILANAATGVTGNLIDLQLNAVSKFSVTQAGAVTTASTVNGQTISAAANFTGTVTAATGLTVSAGGITVSGASTITGTLGGLTGLTVVSGGETITAGGLTVTAGGINVNASGITNAGAISGATTIAASTSVSAPTLGSANTSTGSTNSAATAFQSGNASGATSNSGAVTVDSGTATGTAGTVSIGGANSSGTTVGRGGAVLTLQGNTSTTLTATTGTFTTTVGFTTPTANRAINFPDAGGTLCTTTASTCNATYQAAGSYLLQNPAANNASTSNFTGYQYSFTQSASTAAGNLQLSNAGTNSALSITQSGNPAAGQAAILVNNSNGSPSGNLLDLQTGAASKLAVDFNGNITQAGGTATTDTINGQRISAAANFTGTVTSATGVTVSAGGITVTGASTITGTLGGLTGLTVVSGGETITAGGLNVNSTGITNAGAISGATTIAASTSVSAPTLSSADTAVASTNSAATTFRSGNASGATSNSGAVTVDSGTATGTAGTVAIGGTNSSGTTVGRSGALLTLQGNASTTFTATSGANTTTVSFTAPTAARSIVFPDAGGTVCTTTASTCNATYQAAGSYLLQNPAANNASTSNFTGYQYSFTQSASTAAGNLQLSNAGTSSALAITQTGNPSAGQALIFANNTNGTPSGNLVDLQAGSVSKFSVTSAGAISNSSTINGQTISATAALTGTLSVATGLTVTSGGETITAGGLLVSAGGINVNNTNITNAGAISGATTIALNSTISGGTTYSASTAVTAPVHSSADTAVASTNSAATTFRSGNASGTTSNSGAVTVDSGTATGTAGTVVIGGTNSSGTTVGRSGAVLTLQGNSSSTIAVTSGANTSTISFTAPTAARSIVFSDAGGTVCTTTATTCNATYQAAGSYLLQNPAANNASSSSFTGYQYSFTQSSATAAGNLQLSNSGTNSALSITQSGNPSAGQAALLINNSNGAPSGNLLDLQAGAASKLAVDASGNVTQAGGTATTDTINGQRISAAANFTGTVTAATGLTVTAGGATIGGNSSVTGTLGVTSVISATGTGATELIVSGAPLVSATSSLIQIGNAIAGGNATAGTGGTYIGLNAPSGGGGSTADLLNLQVNSASKLQLTTAGDLTVAGKYNSNTFTSSNLQFGAAGTATIQAANTQALIITGHATSTWSTDAGNLTIQDTAASSTLALDSGASGTINIGNSAATTLGIGRIASTTTLNGINQIGASAGNGSLVNNGSTVNSVYNMANLAGGGWDAGGAAATVDKYTYIGAGQTTTLQTLTPPAPTANTTYGRVIYITNTGTASFTMLTTTIGPGSTATLVWALVNGTAKWTFAGADGSGILNQNTADQTADFRITGTGRANTSITTPLVDSITGGLNIGTATATGIVIGGATTTGTISLGGSAASTINIATGAFAHTVAIATDATTVQGVTMGSTNGASATTIQAGTGNLNLVTNSASAGTIVKTNTNSATAFLVQNAIGANILKVDTTDSNLVINPGAEAALGAEWAAYGANTTVTRSVATAWNGAASLSVAVGTATASVGAKNNLGAALTANTAYTVSFYAKLNSGSFTDIAAAYSRDGTGGTEVACGSYNTQTIVTGGWTRITCTLTTSVTAGTASAYLAIRQTASASRTFFLDAVQLEATANIANAYGAGALQLNAVITSPLSLENVENSTNAFSIQSSAGSTKLFTADTLNDVLRVGSAVSSGAQAYPTTAGSGSLFVSSVAEVAGTLYIGNASNGVSVSSASANAFEPALSGTARHQKNLILTAEFAGAVLDADGTSNLGTMTAAFESTQRFGYYKWVTSQGTAQDYDVVATIPVPDDWSAWTGSPTFWAYGSAGSSMTVTLTDTAGTVATNYNASALTVSTTWTARSVATPAITGTYTQGSSMIIRIHMTAAATTGDVRLGTITLPYLTRY